MIPDEFAAARVFLTSLGLGLIMGLERERRAGANAGIRTFGLVAIAGSACALLGQESGSPFILPAAWLGLALMMIAADQHRADPDGAPDTTTTVALLLCFAFGAMLWYGYTRLAVALSLATTTLLYFKAELHGVTHRLTRQDMVSFLQFAAITFVVLPLLPDEHYGPYGALNPYEIWLMVVLISAVSLAGYAALRLAPASQAVPLLGLFGGLVSSTATTLAFARHMRAAPGQRDGALAVILIANLVVLLRIAVLTAAVAPALLPRLLPVLLLGAAAGTAGSLRGWLRLARERAPAPELPNPANLIHAFGFAVVFGLVLLVAAWLHEGAGIRGVYAVAAVSGLFDIDAITISTLQLAGRAEVTGAQAALAILIAYAVNLAMKLTLLTVIGGRAPLPRAAAHGLITMAGLGGGWLWFY